MRTFFMVLIASGLIGCAGKVDYFAPSQSMATEQNSKLIPKPRDQVWAASVPALSRHFFIINNLDKSSGLINLSYAGNPQKYIDCGRIRSYVKNMKGERVYNFAGAKAQQSYEVMNPSVGLFLIDRRVSLEGRVNLIFEEVDANTTRVTANTRYVVTRTQIVRNASNSPYQTNTESISFNSGGSAQFTPQQRNEVAECSAMGVLEQEILSAVQ